MDSDHITCVEIEAGLHAQLEASRTHVSLLRSELAGAMNEAERLRKRYDVLANALQPAQSLLEELVEAYERCAQVQGSTADLAYAVLAKLRGLQP